jgi:hypothetical protein
VVFPFDIPTSNFNLTQQSHDLPHVVLLVWHIQLSSSQEILSIRLAKKTAGQVKYRDVKISSYAQRKITSLNAFHLCGAATGA